VNKGKRGEGAKGRGEEIAGLQHMPVRSTIPSRWFLLAVSRSSLVAFSLLLVTVTSIFVSQVLLEVLLSNAVLHGVLARLDGDVRAPVTVVHRERNISLV